MGIYLNPGNELLKQALRTEIYVDKSMIISELNKILDTEEKYVCVSRPRRFGKTMASSMITAYYSKGCDSKELFSGLNISKEDSFEDYLNKYNVIQIDLNNFYKNCKEQDSLIDFMTECIKKEITESYPKAGITNNDTLANSILKVYASTKQTFIIILDEYDVLIREKASTELFNSYLDFLSSLFKNSTLKPAISLAYLTGILPIVRDKIQSKLNEFDEYSMVNARQLSEFTGFTEDETKALCKKYDMDFEECRRWYNGYTLTRQGKDIRIYSPKSVVQAMKNREIGDYWSQTGSYEALKLFILMNFEGIRDDVITMIGGGKVNVNVRSYLNTMTDFNSKDDVFTYLIHLGYLTYDRKDEKCFIPNNEIRSQWVVSIKDEANYKEIIEMMNDSKNLLEQTITMNEDYIAQSLDKAHMRATNPLTYNNEAAFQSAIGLAYFYANAKYTVIKELPTGKGYADLALIPFIPNIPAIIIELKNNKTAESAVNQIKERKYYDILQHYHGNLLFVGVNYDSESKKHECKIQKMII